MSHPSTVFVATHLTVGAVPTTVSGPFVQTEDLGEAVVAMRDGATVVLPEGGFDLAEAILLALGATTDHARFSRLYAEGRLPGMRPPGLAAPCPTVDDEELS